MLAVIIFGGARFQTGYDWLPYTSYFELLPTNPIEGLTGVDIKGVPSMEPGYFLLNYIVKSFGLSVDFVFLAGAFFNCYALRRLLSTMPNNNAFSLFIQVSFSLIYFYFSTVRQAAAVGFILLACRELILARRTYVVFIYSIVAISFHVSSIMYVPILLLATTRIKMNSLAIGSALIVLGIPVAYFNILDLILNYISNNLGFTFFEKFTHYAGIQKDAAWPTYCLLALSIFSSIYISTRIPVDRRQEMLAQLASLSGLALAIAIIASPNVSTTWTRMLMISCTLHGFWYSAHCTYLPRSKSLAIKLMCTSFCIPVYGLSIYRSESFLVPYQTILDKLYFTVDPTNEINTILSQQGVF